MAVEAAWFRVFVWRSLHQVLHQVWGSSPADQVWVWSLRRARAHIEGITSDTGRMFAVVHGGESVLAEPQAS